MKAINHAFATFSEWTALALGSSYVFILALALVVAWAASGPLFHFSDLWELFINTITTVVTFLMIFLVQNSQNRNAYALHLKIDELILATSDAPDAAISFDGMSDDELTSEHERITAVMEQRKNK